MIFPSHCRLIGVVEKYCRKKYSPSDVIYFSSQYLMDFNSPETCDIYEIKSEGEGFLRKATGVRKIVSSNETLLYDEPVDITNRADLVKKASKLCDDRVNTIIFRGIDRHMTFVHKPDMGALVKVDVFDVSPPDPAWLAYNIKRLDGSGMFGELMLDFNYNVLDLKKYEDNSRTTIFPCKSSGLSGLFLDSLEQEPDGDIKLVGCNTSKLVFEARYPLKKYELINICPLSIKEHKNPFILRCCQSDKLGPVEISGVPGVVVHWGANPREIYEAVRLLAGKIRG
jgi:hypothetical protein